MLWSACKHGATAREAAPTCAAREQRPGDSRRKGGGQEREADGCGRTREWEGVGRRRHLETRVRTLGVLQLGLLSLHCPSENLGEGLKDLRRAGIAVPQLLHKPLQQSAQCGAG